MFIDEAIIRIQAGDGGNGVVAFRREKFVPRGGPAGGDGGAGGDVILESKEGYNTLLHFKYNPEHKADRGRHGEGSNRTGKSAPPLTLPVPPGTIVYDADTGEQLFDFDQSGLRFIAAKGGQGGRGNARFATSVNQAPRHSEPGEPGEHRRLRLEVKLLADVGLVGFPNAGKSTLISRLSAARPKIADYPFTTLEPNLGVVDRGDYDTFVIADIPGLIEGAHEGHGLGIQFLKHVERTAVLLHLIDVSELSDRDPIEDYRVIVSELGDYSPALLQKPMIVAAHKDRRLPRAGAAGRATRLLRTRGAAVPRNLVRHRSRAGPASPRPGRCRSGRSSGVAGVRLALFGGTFDPIHSGHLEIAAAAAETFDLDRILFIPGGDPPHKSNPLRTPYRHRYRMVELACETDPRFEPSRLEDPESLQGAAQLLVRYDHARSRNHGPGRRAVLPAGRGRLS